MWWFLDIQIIIKNFLLFFTRYKNEWKEHNFQRQKDLKSNFYRNKKLFKIDNINANKILASKNKPYGADKSIKYFVGYDDDHVIRLLCIKPPQIIGYDKCFDSYDTISFIATNTKC